MVSGTGSAGGAGGRAPDPVPNIEKCFKIDFLSCHSKKVVVFWFSFFSGSGTGSAGGAGGRRS